MNGGGEQRTQTLYLSGGQVREGNTVGTLLHQARAIHSKVPLLKLYVIWGVFLDLHIVHPIGWDDIAHF